MPKYANKKLYDIKRQNFATWKNDDKKTGAAVIAKSENDVHMKKTQLSFYFQKLVTSKR